MPDLADIEKKLERKAKQRHKKKRPAMKVSGRGVFILKRIIHEKARTKG